MRTYCIEQGNLLSALWQPKWEKIHQLFAAPARLLYTWDSPGKNTGVGCHFLLQGIFLTQGSNLGPPALYRRGWPSTPPILTFMGQK